MSFRFFASLAFLSLLSTTVAAEIPVSSIQYGPADHAQVEPRVATNGDMHLAVWLTMSRAGNEIAATRISASGEILDRVPIRLGARAGYAPLLVAWTGRVFVVALVEHLDHVLVTRLVKIDTEGRIVGETAVAGMRPLTLTCSSQRCLLTGVRLQLEAIMFDVELRAVGESQTIGPAAGNVHAATATNGTSFLVTWRETDQSSPPLWVLRAAIVRPDGTPETPQELPADRQFLSTHAVTTSGTDYVVVWDERSYWGAQNRNSFVTYRLSGDGEPSGQPVKRPVPAPPEGSLSFTPAEAGFLGFLKTDATTAMFEITAGGELRAPPIALEGMSAAFAFWPSVTTDGVLILTGESNANADIYVRLFTRSGEAAGGPTVIVESARAQRTPAILWDGSHIVTVWEELAGPQTEVRMSKMRSNAAPDLELTVATSTSARLPAIAFNGTEYLVVWLDGRDGQPAVTAQRIGRSGTHVGPPVVLSQRHCGEGRPSVTSNGRDFLAAWTDCSNSFSQPVVARVVDGQAGERLALSAQSARGEAGAVTWNGSQYVVAWLNHERINYCGIASCVYWSTVRVSRLTAAGELIDATGIVMTPEVVALDAKATAGPAGVLVTWLEEDGLKGARLGVDGTSETPRPLMTRRFWLDGPVSIAAVGTNFVASYSPYGTYDVMTATITPQHLETGVPATASALVASPDVETDPVVVAISARQVAVAYQRIAREPQYRNANRVFVRTFVTGEASRRRRAVGTP